MTDLSSAHVQALVETVAPDLSSLHIQGLIATVEPNLSSAHVQVLATDEQVRPPPPRWMPLYVLTEDGWIPTFPRWLFDNHPPRGTP